MPGTPLHRTLPKRAAVAAVVLAATALSFSVSGSSSSQQAPRAEDRLAQILASLGIPFVPPGFRERFHVGRVAPPNVTARPGPAPGFMPAEWEPAIGVFVVWPRNLPEDLLVALAENVPLYVITEEGTEAQARAWLLERIDAARFRILTTPRNSGYPRDMGPQMVFDAAGHPYFIEQPSRGAPQFGLDTRLGRRDEPTLTLWDPQSLDELVAPAVGRQLDVKLVHFPGFLTGGNFLVDGLGGAFFSDAQLDENYPLLPPKEFEAAIKAYLGIDRPSPLENFAAFGIQHLDTWMKVLDPYRVLVIRPPLGHAEEAPTQRNLELLRRMKTFDGRPWQIIRIDTPAVSRPREWPRHIGTAAYTNSLVLNDTIYVPLYGIPEDERALATYRRAMPGYEVRGFVFEDWRTFDAIHCRARAMFDPEMLRITPLAVDQLSPRQLRFSARIVAYGRADLNSTQFAVHWRNARSGAFAEAPLIASGTEHVYSAIVPRPLDGGRIEYYFTAVDDSGRRQSAPPVAPAASYSFPSGG